MLNIHISNLKPGDAAILGYALQRIHASLIGEDITDKAMIQDILQNHKDTENPSFAFRVVQTIHGISDTDPEFDSITQRLIAQEHEDPNYGYMQVETENAET